LTPDDKLSVIIRKRPIFPQEEISGEIDCLSAANPQIIVHEPKLRVDRTKVVQDHVFIFDNTYNEKVIFRRGYLGVIALYF
jgi:kinesin family protein 2/24